MSAVRPMTGSAGEPSLPAGAAARLAAGPLTHMAVLYGDADDYAATVGGFVRDGLAAGDPVMVAVPAPQALLLRDVLDHRLDAITFVDMAALGRNPARIMPAVQTFADAHSGQLVRYVGEPVWTSRTPAERAEAIRHEALLNLAFARRPLCVLCPYGLAGIDPGVLAGVRRTHPVLMRAQGTEPSPDFADGDWPGADEDLLPPPPAGLAVLTYRDEPAAARAFVRARASAAGLREPALTDLVIAVGELAANTLRHTSGSGTVAVWATAAEVICEVRDTGYIRDALAGRRFPVADAGQGHGLWVVHQVCDLVEMRTGNSGTTFRLHMGLRS
jgi:anti-sigma regulatory factor (Ser/Thr protein kinase)